MLSGAVGFGYNYLRRCGVRPHRGGLPPSPERLSLPLRRHLPQDLGSPWPRRGPAPASPSSGSSSPASLRPGSRRYHLFVFGFLHRAAIVFFALGPALRPLAPRAPRPRDPAKWERG